MRKAVEYGLLGFVAGDLLGRIRRHPFVALVLLGVFYIVMMSEWPLVLGGLGAAALAEMAAYRWRVPVPMWFAYAAVFVFLAAILPLSLFVTTFALMGVAVGEFRAVREDHEADRIIEDERRAGLKRYAHGHPRFIDQERSDGPF